MNKFFIVTLEGETRGVGMNRVLALFFLMLLILFPTQIHAQKSTKGTYFEASRVEYIKKWKTTQKDIRRLFGEPMERKSRFDEVWTYMYYETEHMPKDEEVREKEKTRPGEARSLEITFRKGIVADFSLVEFNAPIADDKKPMELSGFSFLPPRGGNWKILMRTNQEVSFVRKTGDAERNIIAFVSSVPEPEGVITTMDDLERAARNKLERLIKDPGVKQVMLKRKRVTIDNQDGIELRGIIKTAADDNSGRDRISTIIYHVCLPYPDSRGKGVVHLGYIERVAEGGELLDIDKEIRPFIESFEFKNKEE